MDQSKSNCTCYYSIGLKGWVLNKFFTVVVFVQDLFMCMCETWSFTFSEEQMLRVMGNGVWRKVFASE
jgi:hypothetical protein